MNEYPTRRFLAWEGDWRQAESTHIIVGGWEADNATHFTVSLAGQQGFLTLVRHHAPATIFEIPVDLALALLEQADQRLEKLRYQVEYEGQIWFIDAYQNKNESLVLAEYRPTQPLVYPAWLGSEVTDDTRYSDDYLLHTPYNYWAASAPEADPFESISPPVSYAPSKGILDDWALHHDNRESRPLKERDAEPARYVNAGILDHDREQPLQPRQIYTLAVDIGEKETDESIIFDVDQEQLYRPGETAVDLEVYFSTSSPNIRLHTQGQQRLRLPRNGRSQNRAYCHFEALRAGEGKVTAFFFKENNFIQATDLTLNAGDSDLAIKKIAASMGRPPGGAFNLRPRQLTLVIRKSPSSGYDVTMVGAVQANAHIRPEANTLDHRVKKLRQALLAVVNQKHNNRPVYQVPIETAGPGKKIPDEVNQAALQTVAREGWHLFNTIFTGDNNVTLMKRQLLDLAQRQTLRIQIVAQGFFVPWGLLYLAERFEPTEIDAECFLGFKHIVEQIPLQQKMAAMDVIITSQPSLHVGIYLNKDLDKRAAQSKLPLIVAPQQAFWEALGVQEAAVSVKHTAADLLNALKDGDLADQFIYIYGHARSEQLDGGDPDASNIELTGPSKVTLGDLMVQAPEDFALKGAPLIFLNACESAEMTSAFYGGFMPYFIDKGARGFIGTECDTPALFAAEWAHRFFARFLTGEKTVGEIFLELRREFYYQHNNLLGLLYALYCDGDTRLEPGLHSLNAACAIGDEKMEE